MRIVDYASWASGQVMQLSPDQFTKNWATAWDCTLTAMRATGVYEHIALLISKWEFLGGLLLGSSTSSVAEARAYADRFLPQYYLLHNLSGGCPATGSELFSAFRNKALHGFTPSAISLPNSCVATWTIPAHPNGAITCADEILIDSASIQDDFIKSMSAYASYLAMNVDVAYPLSPQERWRRSFWCRFNPVGHSIAAWELDGRNRQLFP